MVLYVSYGWYYGCLGFRRDIGVVGGWCEGEVLSEMGFFFRFFCLVWVNTVHFWGMGVRGGEEVVWLAMT